MPNRIVLLSFLNLLGFVVGLAQATVDSMQLLSPQTGWASTGRQLLWTTDAGLHWKDITPAGGPDRSLVHVAFLDTSRGWALLVHHYPGSELPRFDLASTADTGASWSIAALDIPNLDPSRGLSDQGWLHFADALHGWVMLRLSGNTAVSIGTLLVTQDGGRTWTSPAVGPPVAGPMHFVSPQRGWLAGGPEDKLYATQDGGATWQEVSVATPPQIHGPSQPTYHLPVFEDRQRGLLTVSFDGPEEQTRVPALFATADGGRNWKLIGVFRQETSGWKSAVTDSDWITAVFTKGKLTLKTVTAAGNSTAAVGQITADLAKLAGLSNLQALSFGDRQSGWGLLGGRLLCTHNGGMSWKDVTPAQAVAAHVAGQPDIELPGTTERAGDSLAATASPTISQHLAFDKSRVITTSDMQNWWNHSPFWDTGLYLPGSPNRGHDVNLNAAWVSAIKGQGWGLIPIWFGLQPPCACGPGSTPTNCVPFTSVFSTDATTAHGQGAADADAAIAAANTLGLSPTIIYHDIEFYAQSSATACHQAVTAFVSGWGTELSGKGIHSGVYATPAAAQNDISTAAFQPDDIWIAKYDNRVTILGLNPLSHSLWKNNSRIHQWQENVSTSYGGTTSYNIDPNIVDARIEVGNGTKSYFFNIGNFAFGGFTEALCINNINSASGGLINGSGQTGQIVGDYFDGNGESGFLYDGTTFTQIAPPGSLQAYARGINNTGQIVGFYDDGTGGFHGFVFKAGTYTQFDVSLGTQTLLAAINDAGQVVGQYSDTNGGISGFLGKLGSSLATPFNFPGAAATQPQSINGDGKIAGNYQDSAGNFHGFVYDPSSGQFDSIDYPGATATLAYGINNNGQVLVQADGSAGVTLALYNLRDATLTPLSIAGAVYAYGINDSAQIVGQNTAAGGYVAAPSN